MTNLTPVSSFDDVPRLETATLALGGPGGPMNLPAQALLNRTQWLHDNAVAGTSGPFGIDTGGLNACAVTFTPAITSLADGLKLRFTVSVTNTAAATFSPNGMTAKPILGGAQAALQGGELLGGGNAEVVYDSTLDAWVLVAQSGGAIQVADAAESKQAVNHGQLVASVGQVTGDLASSDPGKGADLVYDAAKASAVLAALGNAAGFQQSGSGTQLRNFEDALRDSQSSVFNFLTSAQIADVEANTASIDCTAAVQAAINASKNLLIKAGTYLIDPSTGLQAVSGITVTFEPGAIFKSKTLNGVVSYELFHVWNVDNVTIIGGQLQGERTTHTGTFGEFCHGLSVRASTRVSIRGMKCSNFVGDGFYIGRSSGVSCDSVTFTECVSDNNYRQGCSITTGSNILLDQCQLTNTNGTAPQAGVDIESDDNTEVLQNIRIQNCYTSGNAGYGVNINPSSLDNTSGPISITVSGHRSAGDVGGLVAQNFTNAAAVGPAQGTVYIDDFIVENSVSVGMISKYWNVTGAKLVIKRPRIINPNSQGSTSDQNGCGISIGRTSSDTATAYGHGNIQIIEPYIADLRATHLMTRAIFMADNLAGASPLTNCSIIDPLQFSGYTGQAAVSAIGSISLSDKLDKMRYSKALSANSFVNFASVLSRSFDNAGTAGAYVLEVTLPDASKWKAPVTMEVRAGSSSIMRFKPASGQSIMGLAGSPITTQIQSSTVGSSLTLQPINATQWGVVGMSGTWS